MLTGDAAGRTSDDELTIFDSVGFAIEDFAALTFLNERLDGTDYYDEIDLVAEPSDPKNLFGLDRRPPSDRGRSDDHDGDQPVRRPAPHSRSLQAPSTVVMIRPHHFAINQQTAADNVFQSDADDRSATEISAAAFAESTALADALSAHGVTVHLFDDDATDRPDSVFPNNWFSTHRGGRIVMYPMYTVNRRRERRTDVIELLKEQYRVQDVIDYSGLEYDELFLEGTGAMVLDHIGRVAYVARSHRADPLILERFCTHNGFEPMVFDAADAQGTAIYHTNVLMCVGTEFALVCLDAMTDPPTPSGGGRTLWANPAGA